MRKYVLLAAIAAASFVTTPAQATIVLPGSEGIAFSPFVGATQGTRLAFTEVPGTAFTFAALMRSAVYRNSSGTLDFYYQVARTGPGSLESQEISGFTASNFVGFIVDALVSAGDPDGGGEFTAAANGQFDGNLGSTTTTGRSGDGQVLQTEFGENGLLGTENSATYIFRTNATDFTRGTFGVINGSTFQGFAFQPAAGSAAIPEPAAWAMMIGGFGLAGAATRRRRTTARIVAA